MIERNTAQIRIVEDQAREALRRIELNNVALQEQMRIAEEFIVEEARSENKRLAYELAEYGIDRIAEVDGIEDQIGFGEQLRKQLAEAKNGSGNGNKDMESFLNSMET